MGEKRFFPELSPQKFNLINYRLKRHNNCVEFFKDDLNYATGNI